MFDAEGVAGRRRADPDRAVRLAPARLGRAGSRAVLADARRGLPAGPRRPGRPARRDRRDGGHDPAEHGRRDRRGRATAATGDRLARPAPDRRPAVRRRRDRARVPGARPARHGRRLHGRLRSELAARERAGDVGARSATTCSCPASSPTGSPGASSIRRHRRSASCRSTTSARAWADDGDWKWFAAPVERGWLPELVPPTERLGSLTADAAEATGLRAGLPVIAAARRQGLRGARVRRAHAGRREPVVRHDRDRSTPRPTATSSRSATCPPSRPRSRGRTRWRSRSTAATGWSNGSSANSATVEVARAAAEGGEPEALFDDLIRAVPGGLDGPHPPAVLVTRRPHPGTRGEGRDHRLR